MDRKEVIDLLSKKLNGDLKISYDHLAVLTNYSKRQLIRLSKSLNEKGIDSTLKHGNKGLAATIVLQMMKLILLSISKSYTPISL